MYGTVRTVPAGKLLHHTAMFLDLDNHNLMTCLIYQGLGQGNPGALQLRRRFAYTSTSKLNVGLTILQHRNQKDRSNCH